MRVERPLLTLETSGLHRSVQPICQPDQLSFAIRRADPKHARPALVGERTEATESDIESGQVSAHCRCAGYGILYLGGPLLAKELDRVMKLIRPRPPHALVAHDLANGLLRFQQPRH